MAQLRKRFLPITEKKLKEVTVEFLGNRFVFYRPLSMTSKQTVMLSMVAKQFKCVKLFKPANGKPAEFIFYESDGVYIRNTCSFEVGNLSESQRKKLSNFPIGIEVEDLMEKFNVMFACQQAYIKNERRKIAAERKFRL